MVWAIVSIPISDRSLMERVATANGLRIADGVPTIYSTSGIDTFPLWSERVLTLENVRGHKVYGSSEAELNLMRTEEEAYIRILAGQTKTS